MTPLQLMAYFDQNKSLASREIGCSRATLNNWLEAKRIPKPWQAMIELLTDGKLKSERKNAKS